MVLIMVCSISLNLTVNFFSTKYMMYTSGCPTLPQQMDVQVCSMDELPCYMGSQILENEEDFDEDEDEDCNDDGHEKNTMDMSAIGSAGHDIEKEAAHDLFPPEMDFQVCSVDNPPCSMESQVLDKECGVDEDEDCNNNGHGVKVKDLSATESGSHDIDKGASHDLNPLTEDFDFREPPSTPRVQSFIEFASYHGKGIFGLNKEGNVRLPMQPLCPQADDNPPSTNIFSPKVDVTSVHPADDFSHSVINLLSPEGMQTPFSYRIRFCNKQASTFPETIDLTLTESPIFIQLDE